MRTIFWAAMATAIACTMAWAEPVVVELRNPGFETGSLDGWDRAVPEELFEVTDRHARSGGFSLRAHGDPEHRYNAFAHLVQTVEIVPISGARYQIAGWVRGNIVRAGGKSARLAVRQVDADDRTIRYEEAILLPVGDQWQRVSHRFQAVDGAVLFQVYVILTNLTRDDVVFLDDIELLAIDALGEPVSAEPPPFSGVGPPPERTHELRGEGVLARIDAETGLLSSLELTGAQPLLLHPPAHDGTVVFAQIGAREILFTRVIEAATAPEDWSVLGPDDDSLPLRARVRYLLDARGISEEVVFEAIGAIEQPVRLGVRHGFVPDEWERIICALRPVRVIEAGESTLFTYGEREGDLAPTRLDAWQSVTFPMAVLEGADHWVSIGSHDLDDFVTLAPNQPEGYFPSVQMNPTRVREGESFSFTLTWAALAKSGALLRDAWCHYGENVFTANPLIADYLPYRAPDLPRTLPPGLEVTAGGAWAGEGARIDTQRIPPNANVWYFGWHDWVNERYPTEGEWWSRVGGWARESAEGFRDALAEYQRLGLKCYLYFRHIANLAQRGNELPEEWIRTGAGGALDLYGGGYTLQASPEMVEELGYAQIPWGSYDFNNDDFRAHYLQQVRDCMDFYRPAGIGWDMGWRPGHEGILAVQAEAYRWLREHHPSMRVISNEASGTPSQWFADCILIENGIISGKSVHDYEVAKAFGTQIASIERGSHFQRAAERILTGEERWPFPAGFADAQRYARWSMEAEPLPADEEAATRELGFRLNMRAGLRVLGLGAQWAYVPDARFGPRPVPQRLIELMTDLMALPPLQESFTVRLDGGGDSADGVYAAAWAQADDLVVAVFNDTSERRTVTLALDADALARRGWRPEGAHWSGLEVDSLATLTELAPGVMVGPQGPTGTLTLEPFTLRVYRAQHGDAD